MRPDHKPGGLAEILAALLCAVLIGAPFAYFFWSMKP